MIRPTPAAVLALLLALAPLGAQADDAKPYAGDPLSYSFIEAQYLNSVFTPDTKVKVDDEFEGYRWNMNVSLWKFLYFAGDMDKRRASDYRFGTQSIGLGAHTTPSMINFLQLYGVASYERTLFNDVTGGVPDNKDEGFGVQVGARYPIGSFEFNTSYRYMNYGKTDDIKVTGGRYGVGSVMQLTPYFALTADARRTEFTLDDSVTGASGKQRFDEWTVGFRAYFATAIDRWRRRGGIFGPGQ